MDEDTQKQNGVGPSVGITIVVILFILGGIYFFITQEMKLRAAPLPSQEQVNS